MDDSSSRLAFLPNIKSYKFFPLYRNDSAVHEFVESTPSIHRLNTQSSQHSFGTYNGMYICMLTLSL